MLVEQGLRFASSTMGINSGRDKTDRRELDGFTEFVDTHKIRANYRQAFLNGPSFSIVWAAFAYRQTIISINIQSAMPGLIRKTIFIIRLMNRQTNDNDVRVDI